MPFARIGSRQIHYALRGDEGRPVIAFLNGLTQSVGLWNAYADHFVARGYRVLAYDMLGQGLSEKPVLGIPLAEHPRTLDGLLDELRIESIHLAGISFGGIVALDFASRYPARLESLVVMSTFAELTPQLEHLGVALYEGLTQVGLPYLQGLLYPMNLSGEWLAANRERIPEMKRAGFIGNDLFALQSLMESFVRFEPLTPRLGAIRCPTLIMNGEFDFFTPRETHDLLRRHIANSRLLVIQRAYHAFTLEMPAVTQRQIGAFLASVADGSWIGDQTVWVASEDPAGEPAAFPYPFDPLRSIVPPPYGMAPAAPLRGTARKRASPSGAARPPKQRTARKDPP
jgi:3-oxoadipate enol-lactonase